MTKQTKKITIVHRHPRHVPISKKNPTGITIVSQHPRRIPGSTLTSKGIREIAKKYEKKGLAFPDSNNLDYKDGSKYDNLIAIWTDYFNTKLNVPPLVPLDPNIIKALIGSESDFKLNPKNPIAIGIAQITRSTLKALQDPKGEAKDFTFKDIKQKDLKDPEIAIPLAIRWLFRKRETAISKLKRIPTAEELILEYKGLLKSTSKFQENALEKFRKLYGKLTKK